MKCIHRSTYNNTNFNPVEFVLFNLNEKRSAIKCYYMKKKKEIYNNNTTQPSVSRDFYRKIIFTLN